MTQAYQHMTEQKEASLLWPFLIIGVGIIVTLSFVFIVLKGYKKPHPLLIKPSSVDSFDGVSKALYKAMYPMVRQGYDFKVNPKVNTDEINFSNSLLKYFSDQSLNKVISITLLEINLDSPPQSASKTFNCRENNYFNLYRKKEKKWKKNIYFSVCKEREDLYIMSFSKKY